MKQAEGDSSKPSEPDAPEPGIIRALRLVDKAFGYAEAGVAVLFLASLIFVGAFQAVARNFFGINPEWVDPIIRSSVFLIGMIGAALATQGDRLINIDMLSRLLSARGKLIVRLISAVFTIGICWFYVKSGLIVQGTMVGEEGGGILKPSWVAMALPVCTALMAFHLALHSVIDVYYLAARKTPPPPEGEGLRL